VRIVRWIKNNGSVGKVKHLFPFLRARIKVCHAEIGGKIVGVNL